MNRKTILPLIAAALAAALPLQATAFEMPRGNAHVLLVDDDDDGRAGPWRRLDGRWVPHWAFYGDDGRWDDDDDDDRWDDDWGDDDD